MKIGIAISNKLKEMWQKINLWGKIKNYGKKIKYFFIDKKIKIENRLRSSKLTPTEEELFTRWKEKWNKVRKNRNEEEDIFLKLYKEIYESCSYKASKNKNRNHFFKLIFVIVLAGFYFRAIITYRDIYLEKENLCTNIVSSGAMFLFVVWGASIINKWIDIKKYQETWVRHSNHFFMLKREMIKFIEEMEPYEVYPPQTDEQRAKKFIENILKIGETNQKRFSDNMNNKEKELMDVFDKIEFINKKEEGK